ncbi:MAG: C39 family peptidase, partial [Ignavibacteriales bacterium]|nr:C39 family peptidase [Ignavibacteriales bacterium]
MYSKRILIFSFFVFSALLIAQDNYEQNSYFRSPVKTTAGIICTDNFHSAIYRIENGAATPLVSSPGCGSYYTINPGATLIGYKHITPDGLQIPTVLDVSTNKSKALYTPVQRSGQISFSDDGSIAFTIDESLLILTPDGKQRVYKIGNYANIAPISPDASMVVFNSADDKLFIMDLQAGVPVQISINGESCFLPSWSPDGNWICYSTLDARLFLYNVKQKRTIAIGTGGQARWAGNNGVIFSVKEIQNMQFTGSELYFANLEGKRTQVSNTTEVDEIDPYIDIQNNTAYFTSPVSGAIYSATINTEKATVSGYQLITERKQPLTPVEQPRPMTNKSMDIPYVNQVYDTPDWFNGHSACGPTTAIMAVAFYNLLPKWDGTCSTPYSHVNSWGRYVSDKYTYKQRFYYSSANDPNGKPGYGGFGYMWSSGSPHSRMSSYFTNHGMTSQTTDNPSHQLMVNEINSGYPYAFCVGLTSSGHIVLVHGTGAEQHSLVVNDPYGDKNKPGYPNYYGKNATYDWPGYNNGFQNFQTAYWVSSCRYNRPAASDTLVDNLRFGQGFTMNTKNPATMDTWRDYNTGFMNHCWFAYSKASGLDTCYAEWRLPIFANGSYEVSAYIPGATSTDARYKIVHANGTNIVTVNQVANINKWAVLGSFYYLKGSTAYVRLGDGSSEGGKTISFDAIKWKWTGDPNAVANNNTNKPTKYGLEQNYPNPFNPETQIHYQIPSAGIVRIAIYDILG